MTKLFKPKASPRVSSLLGSLPSGFPPRGERLRVGELCSGIGRGGRGLLLLLLMLPTIVLAQTATTAKSPNGRIALQLTLEKGQPMYSISYDGQLVVGSSALGIVTNIGDYSTGLSLKDTETRDISESYSLRNIKCSHVDYKATELVAHFEQNGHQVLDICFRISNRDVAFRYKVYPNGEKRVCVVEKEQTFFCLPTQTTSFLCPQSKPMGGFARTSPSYETPYTLDDPVGKNGWGEGFTFPCLFKVSATNGVAPHQKASPRGGLEGAGAPLWVLISETGTDGGYVGCRLLNEQGGNYCIGFPQSGELNGVGSTTPSMALPGETPWRTITVGSLADIVETTVPFDLVQPKYEASQTYQYGKGSWSWIIGMDPSCNYDEQKRYIDFSAAMGYQSVLIDAFWDKQIGYKGIEKLARYGKEKGVGLFLWYNSNGSWNDAPQTPIGKMNNARVRRQEMRWMQENGIRGIKVDFFGGDKQPMMQLYEDILSDANDYGLLVIFHGCTLPRGWERMYPNYAASEAVLASENLHFGQGACDAEARNACIHPFIRNTVGAMDFGGSTLNKFYGADNQHGTVRRTSDVFALATAVLFQSPVQHFALAPNNLNDAPAWAIDFMKRVPTTWDELRFIDGYPGKFVIMARRCGEKWYVAGINASQQPLKKTLSLPMFDKGTSLLVYTDNAELNGAVGTKRLGKKQQLSVTIPCNGGLLIEAEY